MFQEDQTLFHIIICHSRIPKSNPLNFTYILSQSRATPHRRLRARDHHTSSTLVGGKGGAGPSSLPMHYVWGTVGVCEWQDGCKFHMHSNMSSNASCFMLIWIVFKNRQLEVGMVQNWETIFTLHAYNRWVNLFYRLWGPTWIDIHRNSIWLRARSHMTSHYTWGFVTTLHDFGGVLGRPLDTSFWALTISW